MRPDCASASSRSGVSRRVCFVRPIGARSAIAKHPFDLDFTLNCSVMLRINDFFCFDDTWKRTFTELLQRSEAVMVDL